MTPGEAGFDFQLPNPKFLSFLDPLRPRRLFATGKKSRCFCLFRYASEIGDVIRMRVGQENQIDR